MCFYQNNKNFINIELHANMKGLTNEEKLIRYEAIKDETRKRLKLAYSGCENLFGFYEEAFNCLRFFELDFLLLNLFLEKDESDIFLYLSNGSLSSSEISHIENYSSRLYNDMRNTFSKDLEVDFSKLEFTKLLNLNSDDWDSVHTDRNEVVKKYVSWLMEENKIEIQSDLNKYSYFLFCKIWNTYGSYHENFSTKAIVFYNTLNMKFRKLLDEGIYINLKQMITELKVVKETLFVEGLEFYPLLDKEEHISNGYNIQRDKFNEYVELSTSLSKSYISDSFESLFNTMLYAENSLSEKLKIEIHNKLDKLHIPNKKELDVIMNLQMKGEHNIIKQEFLRRLYIF